MMPHNFGYNPQQPPTQQQMQGNIQMGTMSQFQPRGMAPMQQQHPQNQHPQNQHPQNQHQHHSPHQPQQPQHHIQSSQIPQQSQTSSVRPNPQLPQMQMPATLTSEGIQQLLDANQDLIFSILENQKLGKFTDCAQYQQVLQNNLISLATVADYQPNMSQAYSSDSKPSGTQ